MRFDEIPDFVPIDGDFLEYAPKFIHHHSPDFRNFAYILLDITQKVLTELLRAEIVEHWSTSLSFVSVIMMTYLRLPVVLCLN